MNLFYSFIIMNYNEIKRILCNTIIVAVLCNYCIYSQNCDDGYIYYSELPDNVTNASSCFYNEDLVVISELININSLTYETPLDIGNQTWLNSRLFNWVLTYTPSGSFGINQKLSQLPDNFGQLSALAWLFIEKHDLEALPDSFSSLSSLIKLYISNNWLISLPDDFGNLTNLTTLDLGYNQLESIPASIGGLINIEYLFLFNNQLTSLPETICDLELDWDGVSPSNYPYFASGGNYLCDSELIPDCVEYSANFNISMEQNYYSFLLDAPQDCPVVDYTSSIQPIFTASCISCHGNSAGLNLASYENLMEGSNDGDVIIPYDHAASTLWQKVNSGQMPPSDNDLSTAQVNLIAQWIDEGALAEPGSGCTDPAAYNCADDDVSTNYIFDIGGIMYDNSCNWDWNTDTEEADYVGGCESGPCDGYYNPGAAVDDGSCRYWQAPHGDEVVITPACGISVDWSAFSQPENSILESYHVQRCLGTGCTWIPGFGIGDANTETSFFDEYDYEEGVEIKYSIAVKYSNNPYWGWAIGASYITPGSPPASGDMNDDGVYNVLDIVALANCVLTGNCDDLENGCAGDMNSDAVYNILDIVNLANCVLAGNCGG